MKSFQHRFKAGAAAALFALVGTLAHAAAPQTMKAIRYDAYGPASVLQYVDVPVPKPAAGEVLLKVQAAGVNPIDWKLRSGRFGADPKRLPVIPGFDVAGTVEGLGEGATGFKRGDPVFALVHGPGAYAQYTVVPAKNLVRTPANIDARRAAAIPTAAATAWRALFDAGKLQRGQTVLIHGAAGGVGHFAVQLAKHAGARVIGTASASNAEFIRKLGVEVAIDYRTQRFEEIAKDVDLVIDTIGGETLARSYGVLRKGGTIVSVAGRLDPEALAQHGVRGDPFNGNYPSHLDEIAALVAKGDVVPEIGAEFDLAQAAAAHTQSETGHARGKMVLTVGAAAKP